MMYRPSAFAVDDIVKLHEVIRERSFATFARAKHGAVTFAYAPTVLDDRVGTHGALRVHFSTNNSIVEEADGAQFDVSFVGPDAYISPDWYVTPGIVPTWNYIAVEGRGTARKLDAMEMRQLLIDLSANQEQRLLPKKPWTIDKVPEAKLNALLGVIVGFEIRFEQLEGKFKLSQNVKKADFDGAARGLETRGDAASAAVARAMRKTTAP
jgi:transcriptional regulator